MKFNEVKPRTLEECDRRLRLSAEKRDRCQSAVTALTYQQEIDWLLGQRVEIDKEQGTYKELSEAAELPFFDGKTMTLSVHLDSGQRMAMHDEMANVWQIVSMSTGRGDGDPETIQLEKFGGYREAIEHRRELLSIIKQIVEADIAAIRYTEDIENGTVPPETKEAVASLRDVLDRFDVEYDDTGEAILKEMMNDG